MERFSLRNSVRLPARLLGAMLGAVRALRVMRSIDIEATRD
jgi:hypothetical protein